MCIETVVQIKGPYYLLLFVDKLRVDVRRFTNETDISLAGIK